jgi:serine/threonine-protein kinase
LELQDRKLGEFVIKEKIGEGSFGEVYRAEQPSLAREAVIKVARRSGDAMVERFLREARTASKIDHPYAAHVYAFGAESDGVLWIAMELVRGTTLGDLLSARGAMPLERFVPFFERLCEVLHDAHEQGIVHRDVKPDNVMVLSKSGRLLPKLLDLGVAKLGDETDAGKEKNKDKNKEKWKLTGSPLYMAPEQWKDASTVDRRTDVYALGMLGYEALTGKPPFRGNTLIEIAKQHA